jgi:hypothetical protein
MSTVPTNDEQLRAEVSACWSWPEKMELSNSEIILLVTYVPVQKLWDS